MVIMPESLPRIKLFLKPVGLNKAATAMLVRWIAAFILHFGAMSASQAAGAIRTDSRHRAQMCRSLGRKFWNKYQPTDAIRNVLLAMESQRGRFIFILDQTLCGHQGKKTQNTYSTGNRKRRPRKGRRYNKYKYAPKRCHCFVMGLLITPSGYRIPFNKSFYTKEFCSESQRAFQKQTDLAADLIRELPVPEGAEVVVLGDTAFEAKNIRQACQDRHFTWIVPLNSERVLEGPKPRSKVRSLVSDFTPGQFTPIRLHPGKGNLAVYRRVSSCRMGSKMKPRTYYVHQERRVVHSIGEVQLIFSTTKRPTEAGKFTEGKILVTGNLKLTKRELVELYDLRWQIELFFKELKSTLGFDNYRFEKFACVEQWVEMTLLTFIYLEWHRAKELHRRDAPEDDLKWWRAQRTHGLCQAIRQATDTADLQVIAERLKTPSGIRRLKRQLKNSYPLEYRSKT